MKKALYALMTTLLSLFLFSCSSPLSSSNSSDTGIDDGIPCGKLYSGDTYTCPLSGLWVSSYAEYFYVSGSTMSTYYTSASYNAGTTFFAGSDLYFKKISDSSGYIYFQITSSDTDAGCTCTVGNWYACYYEHLSTSYVSISEAYHTGYAVDAATLDLAVSTFTVSNGYFSVGSECKKIN